MVRATYRDCEFVAHSSADSSRLCESEVVRIRGNPSANETGLRRDQPAMLSIFEADCFRCQGRFSSWSIVREWRARSSEP